MPVVSIADKQFVPFVFATTGHRLLREDDEERLRGSIRSIFKANREKMPDTPLVLLSGLAEGADQLVAECALALDVALFAVLPLPLPIYRDTMSPSAAQNLDRLLAQASVVRTVSGERYTQAEMAASEDARAACYDEMGRYLAVHCQALIALWDAAPSDKIGGTAQVVEYVLHGVGVAGDTMHDVEHPQTGIVYHVLTPRPEHAVAGTAGTLKVLMGKAEPFSAAGRTTVRLEQIEGTAFARVQESIARFNGIARRCPLSLDSHYLVPRDVEVPRSDFLDRVDSVCAQADAVSRRAARQRRRFLLAIVMAISVGTLWYSIADEVYKEELGLWLVLPIMISAALLLNRFARHARVEDLYIDSRALSEALRVQYFWEMACISEEAVDHYLPHHTWEVDWVRCALRNLLLFREDVAGRTCSAGTVKTIVKLWIDDQRDWYFARAKQQHRLVERGALISKWTLLAGLAWSTIVPLTLLGLKRVEGLHEGVESFLGHWEGWLHVPGVVFTVLAGTYRLWTDQSGFNEQSREYDRIGHYLVRQARFFANHADETLKVQEALVAAGIATLEENARWLLLHRERQLEVVGA